MAKPLVEALELKKDKERNPKIRETQLFQEFQKNIKVQSGLFLWHDSFSNVHLKADPP